MTRPIEPGDTVGILGGGQLGRMLATAAASLGLNVHVFAPEPDSPAFAGSGRHTLARYEDEAALRAFAQSVAVVTYEFENVPAATVAAVEAHCPVRPNGRALQTAQDRLVEKRFLRDLGLETAPFAAVDDAASLDAAVRDLGVPAILKTRRFGYDGKGQMVVRPEADLAAVIAALGRPAILEGMVAFAREVSVIAARGLDGDFRAYDLCENRHRDGILDQTHLPSALGHNGEAPALAVARRIVEALDYVGVIGVELFVVEEAGGPRFVVNEIAPRVHNSGHWTLGGASTSQFEQHIRAICGWPLGSTRRLGTIEMHNLIGEDVALWRRWLAVADASVHLYGKGEARPGRKMGHVTVVRPLNPGP